jgi:undecaprenyl pyrophosphate synthase
VSGEQLDHVLVIPDGSRRHARREFLRDRLRESPEALREALLSVDPETTSQLEARIADYAGRDTDPFDPSECADLLDAPELRPPRSYLLESYRAGARLIDALIVDCVDTSWPRELSIYAMQPSNLLRSDDEVHAFLRAETEANEHIADDPSLCASVRCRFIGDRALLEPHRHRPAIRTPLRDYLESTHRLESAARGAALQINFLAPYDFVWEIDAAVIDGHFDRTRLAVPSDVDLVIRSGGSGRSLGSGALPLQTAFSRYAILESYFPDCSVAHLRHVIEESAQARVRRGR